MMTLSKSLRIYSTTPCHLICNLSTERASPYFRRNNSRGHRPTHPKINTTTIEPFIPHRHNVYDDDELDNMQLGTARLHIGKRPDTNPSQAGQPTKPPSSPP